MKKFTSVMLSVVMILTLTCFGASASDNTEANMENTILAQVLEHESISDVDAEIVSVETKSTTKALSALSDENEKAVQIQRESGDGVEVETLIPFKVLENGEMVNSFRYAGYVVDEDTSDLFVDVVVTSQANYYKNSSNEYEYSVYFYRPTDISLSWSSSKSKADVSKLDGKFDCYGVLHAYPSCINDYEGSKINGNNTYGSSIYRSVMWPEEGAKYTSASGALSSSRAISCREDNHGGVMSVTVSYVVDGITHSNENEIRVVFSKMYS